MEVIAIANNTKKQTLEEKKQPSANKRKKLNYYNIITFKISSSGNFKFFYNSKKKFQKKKFKIYKKDFQKYKPQKKKNILPGVGVGVFLIDCLKNRLLLGKRRESGLFGLPGGWLELGEEWEDCAARELSEETGLQKPNNSFYHVHTLNCRKIEFNYHNISCIMMNEISEFETERIFNPEPHKCYGWFWTSVDLLRKNIDRLFHPLQDFLEKFPQIQSVSDIKKMVKTFNVSKEFK